MAGKKDRKDRRQEGRIYRCVVRAGTKDTWRLNREEIRIYGVILGRKEEG